MSDYQHLLKLGKIGGLSLRNRIIMAPMGSNYAEADGHCGERIQAYYEERAKGGGHGSRGAQGAARVVAGGERDAHLAV